MLRQPLNLAQTQWRSKTSAAAARKASGLLGGMPAGVTAAAKWTMQRPNASVLSEAIPLFFIGRNSDGFWVARDADGHTGGLFLCERSALRFADKCSEPIGCAKLFPDDRFELDVENKGNPLVSCLAAAKHRLVRRAPKLAALIGKAFTHATAFAARISCAHAAERRHRAAIEKELFDDQYQLSSKNDDDLPVLR